MSGLADPGHMAGDRVSPAATAPTPEADPGLSHLQPAALVHAHVYAAIFAASVLDFPAGLPRERGAKANFVADQATKLYRPWPVTP